MGIWSKLFGSDKIIDAGIDGIDAMVFTDEEKSSAKMSFLKLYEPFKVAQRWLSIVVSVPYVLVWSLVGMSLIADMWIKSGIDIKPITAFLQGDMGTTFILINTFYFGGGALEGIVRRFKK